MSTAQYKNRLVSELLFWLHTLIVLILLLAGLFVSVWWVILILILHRLQLVIFHGCLITRLQEREGGIAKGEAYYHLAVRRFFGVNLKHSGVRWLSIMVSLAGLAVAVVANANNWRIHL